MESTKEGTASFKQNDKSKKSAGWIEPLMRRLAYSLHILRHDPPSHVCTIALSKWSARKNTSAPMPLANFPSSKQLALALSRVGVRAAVLEKMEKRLDANGLNTLTDLMLSDRQVATLGFKLYRLNYGILTHSGQPGDSLAKAVLPNTDGESSSIAKINKWIALADIAMGQGTGKKTA